MNSKYQRSIEQRIEAIRTHTLVNAYEAGPIRITHYANGDTHYFVGEYHQSDGQWFTMNYKTLMHDVSNPETIHLYIRMTADRTHRRYIGMRNLAALQRAREARNAKKGN